MAITSLYLCPHNVFVYHFVSSIAEQWDLAKPIQTCGFQVERRNNDLFLLFTTDNHSKLFALAKLHEENVAKSVEPVMDSSRYFVVQVQVGVRSAYVGFGFRERDVALDLLGNLQQFQKSILREQQAKNMKLAEIPKLADGEKIHISFGGSTKSKNNSTEKKKTSAGSGGPFLLKKPPKVDPASSVTAQATAELTNNLGQVQLADPSIVPATTTISTAETTTTEGHIDDDDDWGDFEQA